MAGYMYILECSNGSYYTGSTKYLLSRYEQHLAGEGSNHTRKHPPVALLYYEKYFGIDTAFYREQQVKKWTRVKKEALIEGKLDNLQLLSQCQNHSHCKNFNRDELLESDSDMIGKIGE